MEIDGVLPVVSYVQCEQIRTVSTERVGRHLGSVDAVVLLQVERILRRIIAL